jgi:hypothetical protein
MLDLFVAADLVREQTKKSLATGATPKPSRKRKQRRHGAIRSSSATALRGLANLIEPSARRRSPRLAASVPAHSRSRHSVRGAKS